MKFKWYHVASNLIRRLLLEDMDKIAIKAKHQKYAIRF